MSAPKEARIRLSVVDSGVMFHALIPSTFTVYVSPDAAPIAVPISLKVMVVLVEAVPVDRIRTERLSHLLLEVGAALGLLPMDETVGMGFIS